MKVDVGVLVLLRTGDNTYYTAYQNYYLHHIRLCCSVVFRLDVNEERENKQIINKLIKYSRLMC